MTDEKFESLEVLLDGWFEFDFEELPDNLQYRIIRDFYVTWNGLSPYERRGFARCWDINNNPANDEQRNYTDTRMTVRARINTMRRVLDATPLSGLNGEIIDRILDEIVAGEEWLSGSRSTPTTGDKKVLYKFPLDCSDTDLQYKQASISTKDIDDSTPKPQHPKGGAPKSTITEAVEYAYDTLIQSGNTKMVEPDNIQMFIKHFKEFATDGKTNVSEYLVERIKEIKKTGGEYKITVHPRTTREIIKAKRTGKNITYGTNRISTILSNLRDKK